MGVIGLDIGTTACKAVFLSDDGRVTGKSYREYPVIAKQENWFELDPEIVWESTKIVLAEAAKLSRGETVDAISVSAMGDTVTPFDKNLKPLYNSILAFDTRADIESGILGDRLGRDKIFSITGMPLHPTFSDGIYLGQ